MATVSIIIVAWNGLTNTKLCLKSIIRHTTQPYELILVDNGSRDSTGRYLSRIPGAKVIRNRENHGFAGGCNHGIRQATGDLILLLNNDTIVTPHWLNNLTTCLEHDPTIGLVGPRSNYAAVTGIPDLQLNSWEEIEIFATRFNRPDPAKWLTVADWLPGFCLLIRREVFQRVGLLDEEFKFGFLEDVDFCRRAQQAGYRLACAGDTFVYHFGSRTFIKNNLDLGEIWEANHRLYNRKWSTED